MQTARTYKISLTLAITLHVILVVLFFIKFSSSFTQPTTDENSINIIQAVAITAPAAAPNQPQPNTPPKVEQPAQPLLQPQQIETPKLQEDTQAIQAAKLMQEQKQRVLEQQKEQKEQQAKLKTKQEALIKQQLAEEQKANLLAQHLAAEKATAEAEIKKELAQAQKNARVAQAQNLKQTLSNELAQNLNQESKDLKATNQHAAAISSATRGEIDKYKAMIVQAIAQEWIVPQNLADDLVCKILVNVAPDGVVMNATIIQSSGNALLDNSAKTAVLKASPLPVPKDSAIFENFRSLRLIVRPQGIVSG